MPKQNKGSNKNPAQSKSARVASALTKAGQIAKAVGSVGSKVGGIINTVATVIKAFTGNDTAWYVKYGPVTPAANITRPMNALMLKDITHDMGLAAVCKYIDVNVKWTGWSNTYVFNQVVTDTYQAIRFRLKSNLPYTVNKLKVYIANAITLALYAKQYERDVHWVLYSDPNYFNWQKMYRLTSSSGSYGLQYLSAVPYLAADNFANTVAQYQIFQPAIMRNVFLPDSLVRFISHYFGSLFTDSGDGFNDQVIKINMTEMDWLEYNADNDSITYDTIGSQSISELTDAAIELGTTFGMLIADLNKDQLLTRVEICDYGAYIYAMVYDKTLLQALINGYTSDIGVLDNGYVRLDAIPDVTDPLTQYIFMGGVYPTTDTMDPSRFPPISIINMVYKYDTDGTLSIPAGLTAQVTSDGKFYPVAPFGMSITTDIVSDSYASASTSTGFIPIQVGQFQNYDLTESTGTITENASFNADSYLANGLDFVLGTQLQAISGTSQYGAVVVPTHAMYYAAQSNPSSVSIRIYASFTKVRFQDNTTFPTPGTCCISATLPIPSGTGSVSDYVTSQLGALADKVFAASSSSEINITSSFGQQLTSRIRVLAPNLSNVGVSTVDDVDELVVKFIVSGISGSVTTYLPRMEAQSFTTTITTTNKSGYLGIMNLSPSVVALNSAYISDTAADDTGLQVAIQSNFGLLTAFAADQFDYHIPIVARNNISVQTSADGELVSFASGNMLIKEAYVPYMYNVLDLAPVMYNMMTSLFAIVDWRTVYQKPRNDSRNRMSLGNRAAKAEDRSGTMNN